jgi:hypothetical protein
MLRSLLPALLGTLLPLGMPLGVSLGLPVFAQQSALLDAVKQNPQRGKALCQQLRQYNAQDLSFTSAQVTQAIARQQSLSPADAEVLVTYVVGLYCPDVR